MTPLDPFIHSTRIAYFSMEMALRDTIPTYAGGLGILAGDTLRSSADLAIPLVGVTLVSRLGYFKQRIEDDHQVESPDPWEPARWATRLTARIAVSIEDRDVWIQAWLYVLEGATGYGIPVILLDTDLPDNTPADRTITDELYGKDELYRLKQEIVLGIGGVRILQALGFRVNSYHMNEGHSALLALELLWRYERDPGELGPGESQYDVAKVKDQCIFTTHTPVEAGHDQFSYELVERTLGDFINLSVLKSLAGTERLNMTRLALSLSGYVNGVAKRHAAISNHLFPGYSVHAITNGVHPATWTSPSFAKVYDKHIPEWRHEPEILVRADQIGDDEIWQAHKTAKNGLIGLVSELSGIKLDPDVPIIGFARRMTSYKRADLIFKDMGRLKQIARQQPFQLVLAGKAHPRDDVGKELIRFIHSKVRELQGIVQGVFLPDYRMNMALAVIAGSDIWLNTPLRPLEASGTSGMKAAFNGVLNLSVLDGWWIEGHIEDVTGWAIGPLGGPGYNGEDADSFYNVLEQKVLPLYYQNREGWITMMKAAIAKDAYYFNSHRMMRRYATEAYLE